MLNKKNINIITQVINGDWNLTRDDAEIRKAKAKFNSDLNNFKDLDTDVLEVFDQLAFEARKYAVPVVGSNAGLREEFHKRNKVALDKLSSNDKVWLSTFEKYLGFVLKHHYTEDLALTALNSFEEYLLNMYGPADENYLLFKTYRIWLDRQENKLYYVEDVGY